MAICAAHWTIQCGRQRPAIDSNLLQISCLIVHAGTFATRRHPVNPVIWRALKYQLEQA
jgi:hypothetical protein